MSQRINRVVVVIGALFVQVVLGTVYAFSVFVKPLESTFGWNRATTQWAFSIALACFAIAMIPAGRLQDRIGPRKVAYVSAVLLGFSFVMSALLLPLVQSPWVLYLTYGVLGGAGIGFGYVCPIAALVKWYPDKKGLITGIAVAGFGAGALFFAGPAGELMKPPSPQGETLGLVDIILIGIGAAEGTGFGIGWQSFFLIHGIVCFLLVFLGASLLSNPPAGWTPPIMPPQASAQDMKRDVPPAEMLNTPLATILWLTFIFGATSGLMAIGQWTPMVAEVLKGASFAPSWLKGFGRFVEPVGILSLFNAFGRIFWGKVSDYIDRPRAMMLMFLMQGLTCMLLLNVSSPAAVFLVSALVGLNFGGNFALFPAATSDYFGTKYLGANYGWIFTAYGVAGIIGPVAGGILYDITKQYILAFLFAGILCFVAAGTAVVTWGLARAEQPGQANRPIVSPSS